MLTADALGEVIGDLNARGGKIGMISAKGTISIVDAHVPLKPMFGYPTSLRSLTQWQGRFSRHFSHYQRAAQQGGAPRGGVFFEDSHRNGIRDGVADSRFLKSFQAQQAAAAQAAGPIAVLVA